MTDGYVLGVDFGLKHIGIAVGQTVTQTANGIATLAVAFQRSPLGSLVSVELDWA